MNTKFAMGFRILFGAFMLLFGVNKFLDFLPAFEIPGDGGTLIGIYVTSGFLSMIGVLEILGGLALITNKFVPLALTILVAIMFNALVFHILHDPANLGGAAVGLILGLVNVFTHKEKFASTLSA